MPSGLVERRRYPRAAIDYRGVLETTSGDRVNLRTRNISGSGIYFDADKKLTDFTEVSLTVALPPAGKAKALSFRCRGVIVRAEAGRGKKDWPFSAAVHFIHGNRSASPRGRMRVRGRGIDGAEENSAGGRAGIGACRSREGPPPSGCRGMRGSRFQGGDDGTFSGKGSVTPASKE